MCSPSCAAGHFKDCKSSLSAPFDTNVPVVTIQGLTSWVWAPPPVCSGTGWLPAGVQGNAYFKPGKYRCGICGQDIDVDGFGRLVLHPYLPRVA